MCGLWSLYQRMSAECDRDMEWLLRKKWCKHLCRMRKMCGNMSCRKHCGFTEGGQRWIRSVGMIIYGYGQRFILHWVFLIFCLHGLAWSIFWFRWYLLWLEETKDFATSTVEGDSCLQFLGKTESAPRENQHQNGWLPSGSAMDFWFSFYRCLEIWFFKPGLWQAEPVRLRKWLSCSGRFVSPGDGHTVPGRFRIRLHNLVLDFTVSCWHPHWLDS